MKGLGTQGEGATQWINAGEVENVGWELSLGYRHKLPCGLSWDINGYVAPIHAEIRMQEQVPYLTALEEGIFVEGEAIVSGQTVRLYHGKSFTIGNTIFTYIEKDM